jgi:hypothetical protein
MKQKLYLISLLIFFITPLIGYCQKPLPNSRKLIVFYSPSCHLCMQVKNTLMPQIQQKFKDKILIEYRDITDIENYKLLLGLQEKYQAKGIMKNILPVFYFEGRFLNGGGRIKKNLEHLITKSLSHPKKEWRDLPAIDLLARFRNFNVLAITSAGLIDGINPCAFTVIVFFISFLALQGYKKRELIIIGSAFILAVFLTYLCLGLGIFDFLYRLEGWGQAARIINFFIGIFSIILGTLSLYDFFKFKKTKKTEGLILQLPQAVKSQIHTLIGLQYRVQKHDGQEVFNRHFFRLLFSALISGFLVSILEAVCTGQVYLPTITFILKTTPLKLAALSYLLLYNLMFIIPLLVIFLLGLLGVTSEEFSQFLRRHLLTVKILMAGLFFILGIFLIWRA